MDAKKSCFLAGFLSILSFGGGVWTSELPFYGKCNSTGLIFLAVCLFLSLYTTAKKDGE